MNKKGWISIVAVFLAAVAGWFLWPTASEYGDSYSEQQRKLWNERRALFPWAWEISRKTFNYDYFLCRVAGEDAHVVEEKMERKNKLDHALEKEQAKLRDKENLPYDVADTAVVYHEELPADQVSVRECLHRANSGDAEACMTMALNLGWDESNRADMPSWRKAKDVDYWLERAEKLKRPGACFLRHFARLMQSENRKAVRIMGCNSLWIQTRKMPDYSALPGYEELLECLRGGDFMAYRVMCRMACYLSLGCEEKSLLQEALKKQVRAGDVRAMEKMALLITFHFRYDSDWQQAIMKDLEGTLWNKGILMLPEQARKYAWNGLVWMGGLDVEHTETRKEFYESMDCARKAARSGSLTGMNCWLEYGLTDLNYFTREDWAEVFAYFRVLLECDYIPFVKRMGFSSYPKPKDLVLMESFYRGAVLKDAITRKQKKLGLEKEVYWHMVEQLTNGDNAEEARRELDDLIALQGSDCVLNKMMEEPKCWKVAPEVARVYADKVKQLASEGDPLGKLALGYLNEHGLGVPLDLGKAWILYVEAKEVVGIFGCASVAYYDPIADRGRECSSINMQSAASMFMLSLGFRHKDFPGRDEKLMYELAQELDKDSASLDSGSLSYLLGRMYEDGIGTPVDKEKALHYYQNGTKSWSRHSGCVEGLERLQNAGS